jgi:hypothetical protein
VRVKQLLAEIHAELLQLPLDVLHNQIERHCKRASKPWLFSRQSDP